MDVDSPELLRRLRRGEEQPWSPLCGCDRFIYNRLVMETGNTPWDQVSNVKVDDGTFSLVN